jgi:hypothetical protein
MYKQCVKCEGCSSKACYRILTHSKVREMTSAFSSHEPCANVLKSVAAVRRKPRLKTTHQDSLLRLRIPWQATLKSFALFIRHPVQPSMELYCLPRNVWKKSYPYSVPFHRFGACKGNSLFPSMACLRQCFRRQLAPDVFGKAIEWPLTRRVWAYTSHPGS